MNETNTVRVNAIPNQTYLHDWLVTQCITLHAILKETLDSKECKKIQACLDYLQLQEEKYR